MTPFGLSLNLLGLVGGCVLAQVVGNALWLGLACLALVGFLALLALRTRRFGFYQSDLGKTRRTASSGDIGFFLAIRTVELAVFTGVGVAIAKLLFK